MDENERRNKFEKMINLVEEAKNMADDLGEDLLSDALDRIIRDLNEQYDEENAD